MILILSGCTNQKSQDSKDSPDKPMEISMYTWVLKDSIKDSAIFKQIHEKLNVEIKPVIANDNNWNDKLNILISSGETPDVFISKGADDEYQFSKWIKEEIVTDIGEYQDKFPNVKRSLENFEALAKSRGGKYYSLPILTGDAKYGVINSHSYHYHKDWLTNLGLKEPDTIDEFEDMITKFALNDPDGNGKKDTYGITSVAGTDAGIWTFYQIFNAYNTSFDRFRKSGDNWEAECISEESKQVVKKLQEWYKNGILDPEFLINTSDIKDQKFLSGKAGVVLLNVGGLYNETYTKFELAYPDKDPKTIFSYLPILQSKDGNRRADGIANFWCETVINNDISENKKLKALEILDYLLSEEGTKLTRYGVEGVHYKNENNEIIPLLPKDEKGENIALTDVDIGTNLKAFVCWDNDFIVPTIKNRDEIINSMKSPRENAVIDPLVFLALDTNVISQAARKQLIDFTYQTYSNIIASGGDFDTEWNAYVSEWKKKGGDTLITETNKKAKERDSQ